MDENKTYTDEQIKEMNDDLKKLRAAIDKADDILCQSFIYRMQLVTGIAKYKKLHNLPVTAGEREYQILDRLVEKFGEHNRAYIEDLYETVFAASRRMQENLVK